MQHQLLNNFNNNNNKTLRNRGLSQYTCTKYHRIMEDLSSYSVILTTVPSVNTATPTAAFKMGVAYTTQLL